MDERTYSDPEVQEAIRRDFIPVRVDSDQRPDVNDRYNLGGWPTTAFVDPGGEILAGGTYLPPEDMKDALARVAAWWRAHRDEPLPGPPEEASDTDRGPVADLVLARLQAAFDEIHGGFGQAPKFPQADALEFLVDAATDHGDPSLRGIVEASLAGMVEGGLFDAVEGGFFRYATRQDWSEPHYEKMLEDNARLVALLARTAEGRPGFLEAARATGHYLTTTLFTGEHFFGSQDADEAYYSLPEAGRRGRQPPFRDPVLYAGWNATAVRCLAEAGRRLGEDAWLRAARRAFRTTVERCLGPSGLAHTDQKGAVHNLVLDLAELGRAAHALWAVDQDKGAAAVSGQVREILFGMRDGGRFPDFPAGGPGRLAAPASSLAPSAMAGRFLLERSDAFDDAASLEAAQEALAVAASLVPRYGLMAAAAAHLELLLAEVPLRLEVPPALAATLGERLSRLEWPRHVTVPGKGPGVVVCRGETCLLPARTAAELEERLAEALGGMS